MYYKAVNVDTDKALKYIEESRRYQEQAESMSLQSTKKFYEGVRKGLDIAEEIFTCSNCESNDGTYQDGALDTIYYIAKELDAGSQELRDELKSGRLSLDEVCSRFAVLIKSRLEQDEE